MVITLHIRNNTGNNHDSLSKHLDSLWNDIILKIKDELKNSIDEKTQATSQRFFKEKIKFHGVRVPIVNKISKKFIKQIDSKTKLEIFELCDKLWQSGFIEESFIACHWSYYIQDNTNLAITSFFHSYIISTIGNTVAQIL